MASITSTLRDTKKKVAYILENYPESRNNDTLLIKLYWEIFDQVKTINDVMRASSPETIRRCRQRLNEEGLYLPTDPKVAQRRRRNSVIMRQNIRHV